MPECESKPNFPSDRIITSQDATHPESALQKGDQLHDDEEEVDKNSPSDDQIVEKKPI